MKKHLKNKGFTLVELLIATTVFSTILLLCTFGLISVGRSYYKGVTVTRTQEVARNIMDDITQSIQYSGGHIAHNLTPASGVDGFCINKRLYSYINNKMLTDDPNDHAFVVEEMAADCADDMSPQNINNAVLSNNPREFLLPNMRVDNIDIEQQAGRSYKVTVRIISGQTDMLTGSPGSQICEQNLSDSQFCTVSELTSIVEKRLE